MASIPAEANTLPSIAQISLKEQLKISKKILRSQWAFALFSFWCIIRQRTDGSVVKCLLLILLLSFPLAMLAIGSLNVYNCPADVYIPLFVLGWGAVASLKILLSLRVQYIFMRSWNSPDVGVRGTLTAFSKCYRDVETKELSHILSAGVLAASVGLGYMTYRTYGHWTPYQGTITYCNPRFYYFAFCSTTVILSLVFLSSCIVYPFTGAIVYKCLRVYDDVSDLPIQLNGLQNV